MNNRKRLEWPDIIKALSIISIIIGHTGIKYICSLVQLFHVPIFFFISGYFFKKVQLRSHVKKNFKRTIVPYLLVCAVIFTNYYCRNYRTVDLGDGLKTFIYTIFISSTGNTSVRGIEVLGVGAAWFLPAFFLTQLIAQVLFELKYKDLWFLGISFFGFFISRVIELPLHLSTVFVSVLFLDCGYIYKRYENSINDLVKKYSVGLSLIVIAAYAVNVFRNSWVDYASMKFVYLFAGDIIISLFSILLIVSIVKCLEKTEMKCKNLICVYGKNTMVVLCFHAIESALIDWKWCFKFGFVLGGCLAIILKISGSIIAIAMCYRVPILKKLFNVQ